MRDPGGALAAHFAQDTTRVATCWLVVRADGTRHGFTSHDDDLEIDGVTYVAATGIVPSALSSRDGLAVDNAEVAGVLDASTITDADLAAGKWDHATVEVFAVDWSKAAGGRLKQLKGMLGEVTVKDRTYAAEVRSLTAKLNANIGRVVAAGCDAQLGDARCGVDLAPYTAAGVVEDVTSRRAFRTDLLFAVVRTAPGLDEPPPIDYFAGGRLTWTAGANAGISMDVKASAGDGTVTLHLPMPYDVQVGDTFEAVAGCAKSRGVCATRFGNVLNFRGFPDLPGMNSVTRFGGQ